MKKRSGIAIILILMVLGILGVVAGGMVSVGLGNLTQSGVQLNSERAYYAAEAGLAVTLTRIKGDPNYEGTSSPETLVGSAEEFEAIVYKPGDSPLPAGVFLPSSKHRFVMATGISRNGTRRQVGCMVKIDRILFRHAILARNQIQLYEDSLVDYYHSGGAPVTGSNLADIKTLSSSSATVQVLSGSVVKGRAIVPPSWWGGTVDTGWGWGGGTIEGGTVYSSAGETLNPVDLPSDPASAPGLTLNAATVASGTLPPTAPPTATIDNEVVTLPPGVYGDLNIQDGVTVNLEDGGLYVFNSITMGTNTGLGLVRDDPTDPALSPVTVYVANSFTSTGGAVVNETLKPPLLNLLVKSGNVTLNSTASWSRYGTVINETTGYYTVYAPNSQVTIQGPDGAPAGEGGHLFGAVIANRMFMTEGVSLSYDLALRETEAGPPNMEIVSHSRR